MEGHDNYGRFDLSWDGPAGSNNTNRLRDWLAPVGTAPQFLDGIPHSYISGNQVPIAGNTVQYYVNNPPPSYTWDCSSHFQNLSNGNFKAISAGNGYIRILVGGVERARLDVTVLAPAPTIIGPDKICYTSPATYTISSGTVSSWQLQQSMSPFLFIDSFTSTSVTISTTVNNNWAGTIIAYVNGAAPPMKTVFSTCSKGAGNDPGSYVTIYPNPTSGLLYIAIDAEAAQSLLAAKVSSLSFDVRLYDGQGTLHLQQKTKGGTVEFDVTNLPDGFYYVHVYDGVNSTPVMLQVVVEH